MRNKLLPGVAGVLSLVAIGATLPSTARAETVETREYSSLTTRTGTVTELAPSSSTIVVKSEASPDPMRYTLTEKTTFLDPMGKVVSREVVRDQPVTVYYYKDGDQLVVNKVVISKPSVEKKTTTTTTTEEIH